MNDVGIMKFGYDDVDYIWFCVFLMDIKVWLNREVGELVIVCVWIMVDFVD